MKNTNVYMCREWNASPGVFYRRESTGEYEHRCTSHASEMMTDADSSTFHRLLFLGLAYFCFHSPFFSFRDKVSTHSPPFSSFHSSLDPQLHIAFHTNAMPSSVFLSFSTGSRTHLSSSSALNTKGLPNPGKCFLVA